MNKKQLKGVIQPAGSQKPADINELAKGIAARVVQEEKAVAQGVIFNLCHGTGAEIPPADICSYAFQVAKCYVDESMKAQKERTALILADLQQAEEAAARAAAEEKEDK